MEDQGGGAIFTDLAGDSGLLNLPGSGTYTVTAQGNGGNYIFILHETVRRTSLGVYSIPGAIVEAGTERRS